MLNNWVNSGKPKAIATAILSLARESTMSTLESAEVSFVTSTGINETKSAQHPGMKDGEMTRYLWKRKI